MICYGKRASHNSLSFYVCKIMRYGSFGDLAILKNVSKIYLIWWFKIFLTLLTEDKFVRFYLFIGIRFCILVKYLSRLGFCYGLCWPATPSETVCVGRIQTIPDTTDMCSHLVKRSLTFKEDRWQFFFGPQKIRKNYKRLSVSCELYMNFNYN